MAGAEEASRVVFEVVAKSTQITAEVILLALRTLNKALSNKKTQIKDKSQTGKQSVKKLVKQKQELDSIPVSNIDVNSMKQKLKKLGVDFSVVKSKTTGEHSLLFKAKDTAVLSLAIEEIAQKQETKEEKQTLKEKKEVAQEKANKINAEKAQEKAKTQDKVADKKVEKTNSR